MLFYTFRETVSENFLKKFHKTDRVARYNLTETCNRSRCSFTKKTVSPRQTLQRSGTFLRCVNHACTKGWLTRESPSAPTVVVPKLMNFSVAVRSAPLISVVSLHHRGNFLKKVFWKSFTKPATVLHDAILGETCNRVAVSQKKVSSRNWHIGFTVSPCAMGYSLRTRCGIPASQS